jgi:magnesium-protoporphyrin O-methyltransferase
VSCCPSADSILSQFDHRVAERDLRRYRRQGPDATTRLLLSELGRWPLQGATALDIGGGIGVIGAELAGVLKSATYVEVAPAYLEVARRELTRRFGPERVRYADASALLRQAAAKTQRLLALSYPRARWYVRLVVWVQNQWRRVTGNPYRGFVHSPSPRPRR